MERDEEDEDEDERHSCHTSKTSVLWTEKENLRKK